MFRIRTFLLPVTISLALAAALTLSGCARTVIGAGAAAGTAAMEERGITGVADDTAIRLRLNALYSDDDERLWRKIGFQVYGGRVLLTGALDTPEMQSRAIRLAWQADGVTEVINEIEVVQSDGISGYGRDAWIATQLKSKLLFDRKVSSINYSINAVRGKVYLIGIAQSRQELNRVINHARSIDYVQKVVSYVRIKRTADITS